MVSNKLEHEKRVASILKMVELLKMGRIVSAETVPVHPMSYGTLEAQVDILEHSRMIWVETHLYYDRIKAITKISLYQRYEGYDMIMLLREDWLEEPLLLTAELIQACEIIREKIKLDEDGNDNYWDLLGLINQNHPTKEEEEE